MNYYSGKTKDDEHEKEEICDYNLLQKEREVKKGSMSSYSLTVDNDC